mgnify:CR=1 FL=1
MIGSKIAALRIKAGESQIELAAAIGSNQGAISHYEAGKHLPGLKIAAKIAAHYGVTIEYLNEEE